MHLSRPGPPVVQCRPLSTGYAVLDFPRTRSRPFVVASSSKDAKDGKSNEADPKKADFSAYWALKIREMFSQRRRYLEEAEKKSLPDPEIVKRLDKDIKETRLELDRIETEERMMQREDFLQASTQEGAARDRARKALKPLEGVLLGAGGTTAYEEGTMQSGVRQQLVNDDIDMARADLRSATVHGIGLALLRARTFMRDMLLLPLTLATAIQRTWSSTFTSRRYENFLMSEGERIWYWRNRTENERWFWEIYFWDRLLFPIICTVAYEYIVPNNIVWAVVVPIAFIIFQSGEIPGPFNMETWLIMYFGLYQKCWADVIMLLSLFRF